MNHASWRNAYEAGTLGSIGKFLPDNALTLTHANSWDYYL